MCLFIELPWNFGCKRRHIGAQGTGCSLPSWVDFRLCPGDSRGCVWISLLCWGRLKFWPIPSEVGDRAVLWGLWWWECRALLKEHHRFDRILFVDVCVIFYRSTHLTNKERSDSVLFLLGYNNILVRYWYGECCWSMFYASVLIIIERWGIEHHGNSPEINDMIMKKFLLFSCVFLYAIGE